MKHIRLFAMAMLAVAGVALLAACGGNSTYETAKKAYAKYEKEIAKSKTLDELEEIDDQLEDLRQEKFSSELIEANCTEAEALELEELYSDYNIHYYDKRDELKGKPADEDEEKIMMRSQLMAESEEEVLSAEDPVDAVETYNKAVDAAKGVYGEDVDKALEANKKAMNAVQKAAKAAESGDVKGAMDAYKDAMKAAQSIKY